MATKQNTLKTNGIKSIVLTADLLVAICYCTNSQSFYAGACDCMVTTTLSKSLHTPLLLFSGECPGLDPKDGGSPRPPSKEQSSLLRLAPENVAVAEEDDKAEVANLAKRPRPDSKLTGVMVVGV